MEKEKLEIMRHSCAHVVAAAAQVLYPCAKFGVGPVVEGGFYYDIDFGKSINEEDMEKIEKKALELINKGLDFEFKEMSLDDAIEFFTGQNQDYKVSLLNDLKERGTTKMSEEELQDVGGSDANVSLYKTGEFVDLCRGPHVKSTKDIGVFKLVKLAGAYWRGDDQNPMLSRVYGICFANQEELDSHLYMLEEAQKRDHRKLGQELDLFCFSELVGAGLPLFTPRGTIVRDEISRFLNDLKQVEGYEQVDIPHLAKVDLYKTSGHYEKFKEDIFYVKGKSEEFILKPMNCPHHAQLYACKPRSYRDLPVRLAEITKQYRDEQTGELHGLSRVRSISIDDSHLFVRPDQIQEEVRGAYNIIQKFYKPFGMELSVRLSIRDPHDSTKYLGSDEIWNQAEADLKKFLKKEKQEYFVGEGEAAFYGPKLDFIGNDSLGREWQLATIQLDFNQPERFKLEYTDQKGEKIRPVMVHIAVGGSLERFMAIIIEHYAGAFPVWFSPVQIQLVPVSAKHVDEVQKLKQELKESGIRVEIDSADETVGNKVRKAVGEKVPYIVVVGDKELSGEEWTIRVRGQEDQIKMEKEEFKKQVLEEIKERK